MPGLVYLKMSYLLMVGVDTNHGGTLLFNFFQAVHFFVFQESFDIFEVFSYTFVSEFENFCCQPI
ncbi:Uncharacterised protein [Mycobacterium tuberculosis]|nr:Uncharacterised protein [Mycobacterium tuberculosis]